MCRRVPSAGGRSGGGRKCLFIILLLQETKKKIMKVQIYIAKLKSLLGVPIKKRNLAWAKEVCTCSRFIHINVWRFCEERGYVEGQIVMLLKKAAKGIAALGESKGEEEKFEVYKCNIEKRVVNIEKNYLKGKRSAFVPDDMISKAKLATA